MISVSPPGQKRKARESNPPSRGGEIRLSRAVRQADIRLPSVCRMETMGIEPISDCLQDSLACPWNMRPHFVRSPWSVVSSEKVFATDYGLRTKCRGPPGNRTRTSSLPRRRAAVTPADLSVIPDGLEPSFPGRQPGVVAAGPRDHDQC